MVNVFTLKSVVKKVTKNKNYVEKAKAELLKKVFGSKLDSYNKKVIEDNCLVQFFVDCKFDEKEKHIIEDNTVYICVSIQYDTRRKLLFHDGKQISYKKE